MNFIICIKPFAHAVCVVLASICNSLISLAVINTPVLSAYITGLAV